MRTDIGRKFALKIGVTKAILSMSGTLPLANVKLNMRVSGLEISFPVTFIILEQMLSYRTFIIIHVGYFSVYFIFNNWIKKHTILVVASEIFIKCFLWIISNLFC